MKIIKLNDNIKINIESIYSLEKRNNQHDINIWDNEYSNYIKQFSEDPPLLAISDNELFQPIYGTENSKEKMELYGVALSNYINTLLGPRPKFNETYIVILNTGLKINIDKYIYDKINNYLEKYIDEEM